MVSSSYDLFESRNIPLNIFDKDPAIPATALTIPITPAMNRILGMYNN